MTCFANFPLATQYKPCENSFQLTYLTNVHSTKYIMKIIACVIISTVICAVFCFTNIFASDKTCILWPSNVESHDIMLNATALMSQKIEASGNDVSSLYSYTPCSNGLDCEAVQQVMAICSMHNICTQYLAKWDDKVQPVYSPKNNGTFTLTYNNGVSSRVECGHMQFVAEFVCKNVFTHATMVKEGPCLYHLKIETKFACSDMTHTNKSSSGDGNNIGSNHLSTGSMICIFLAILIFIYCFTGFSLSVYLKRKNGDVQRSGCYTLTRHIPHFNFWCKKLPLYTKHGCVITGQCSAGMYRKYIQKNDANGVDYENMEHE